MSNIIEFKFRKVDEECVSEIAYDGTLLNMCEGIVKLVEDVLDNFADKHETEPKEVIADVVKRTLVSDIQQLVDSKYSMDDLFERTIIEMEED